MTIDKQFIEQFISVTSKAALEASYLVGKNNKIAADQAAVDAMGDVLVTNFDFNKKEYEFSKGGY